ncbi:hypothetical protein U9M48_035305 [Paspalum notatum var. saurae]|uniref:Uncharacterized protein n=1 Tax=Paspalum notatum var. saurae TaxID=547442 RepID=A0AAQ3UEX0_PASNO
MGSLLCCLSYPEDGSAAPPVCCFCVPWPFAYHGVDSGGNPPVTLKKRIGRNKPQQHITSMEDISISI